MSVQYLYKSSPSGEGLFYAWFSAMHTRVDVAMYGDRPEDEWVAIGEGIEATIRQLESIGNCYDVHSELALANRQAAIQPVALSNDLYDMLAICKRYHAETMGCFDVTVLSENHDAETMNHVQLSEDAHTLYYNRPGISINLSGFIKGYALEKIKQLLHEHGVANALVNLGNSSILAMGNHPNGWKGAEKYPLSPRMPALARYTPPPCLPPPTSNASAYCVRQMHRYYCIDSRNSFGGNTKKH